MELLNDTEIWHSTSEPRPKDAFVLVELAQGFTLVGPNDPLPVGSAKWALTKTPVEHDGLTSYVDD